ncbi:hypothetical protein MA03_02940 [Infirmifilum uzonense]|uniref:CRISPR type III-B/RAMP module-associated protein Cmr5 n=1 Tax=Infirmifilum uzonense TaxID=1550241 RepID=A0A0F7FGY1_9CREN|nr:type III-B CRISPR module-associated protein Cmr5 [Infirmifilum uzonense]AKG38439.1 hypothetical protein MA03_02940 [Infirmifilum uzonense]
MSISEKDIMELALNAVEAVTTKCSEDVKSSFRARARNMISDLFTSGASYVISVAAARSSAYALETALSVKDVGEITRICEDHDYSKKLGVEKSDDKGYAIYGSLLLYVLKKTGILSSNKLSEAIRELQGNTYAEKILARMAIWLKRFAEAYIHE